MSSLAIGSTHAAEEYIPEIGCTENVGNALNFVAVLFYRPVFACIESSMRAIILPLDAPILYDKIAEIFWRTLIVASTIALSPIVLAACLFGQVLHKLGDYLVEEPFTHLQGDVKQENRPLKSPTFVTQNVCMLPYGLSIFAGLQDAENRVAPVLNDIRPHNPDFLCLQEVSAPMGYRLYEELKQEYRDFFFDIGSHAFFSLESGLFFASKEPILRKGFIPYQTVNDMDRGVFYAETADYWILTTHLSADVTEEKQQIRRQQLGLINQLTDDLYKAAPKPCFLLGDLNIPYDSQEYAASGLKENFFDPFREGDKAKNIYTYSGLLAEAILRSPVPEHEKWQSIDYALLTRRTTAQPLSLKSALILAFDLARPRQARTDHHGIVLQIR